MIIARSVAMRNRYMPNRFTQHCLRSHYWHWMVSFRSHPYGDCFRVMSSMCIDVELFHCRSHSEAARGLEGVDEAVLPERGSTDYRKCRCPCEMTSCWTASNEIDISTISRVARITELRYHALGRGQYPGHVACGRSEINKDLCSSRNIFISIMLTFISEWVRPI